MGMLTAGLLALSALAALVFWVRSRIPGTGHVAAAVTAVAWVAAVSALPSVTGESVTARPWVHKTAVLVPLAAYPYLLFRFAVVVDGVARTWRTGALVLSAGVAAAAVLLPAEAVGRASRPFAPPAWFAALCAQWVVLTVFSGARLWRAGGRLQAGVARGRLRTLAVGVWTLTAALVTSAVFPGSARPVAGTVVALLPPAGAAAMLVGLAAPRWLSRVWRRRPATSLAALKSELFTVDGVDAAARLLLPWVAALCGGDRGALIGEDGRVHPHGAAIERRHLDEAIAATESSVAGEDVHVGADLGLAVVRLRVGWLVVGLGAYTPVFGSEEIRLLQELGTVVDLALARVALIDEQRETARQLSRATQAETAQQELLARERHARRSAEASTASLALLDDLSVRLATSSHAGVEALARVAADAAVGKLAVACVVDLVTPHGLRQIASAHLDPGEGRRLADAKQSRSPDAWEAEVLRSGHRLRLQPLDEPLRAALADDPESAAMVRRLVPGPLLCAPLSGGDGVLGLITWMAEPGRAGFDAAQVSLLEQLARRAGPVLENALLHERVADEERFAREVLNSLASPTAVVDTEARVVHTNRAWVRRHHAEPSDPWWPPRDANLLEVLHEAENRKLPAAAQARDGVRAVLAGTQREFAQEHRHEAAQGPQWLVMRVSSLPDSGGAVISHEDITWPKQAAEELGRRARQQAAIARLGSDALSEADPATVTDQAVAEIAGVLDVTHAEVLELHPEGHELRLVAGRGWDERLIGSASLPAGLGSHAGYTLHATGPRGRHRPRARDAVHPPPGCCASTACAAAPACPSRDATDPTACSARTAPAHAASPKTTSTSSRPSPLW